MPDVTLRVSGREYRGWKAVRVTRGIECIAGGFELEASDRWGGQDVPWPIRAEDECVLYLEGEAVITGHVDRRCLSYGPEERSFRVAGRDRTGALVDCAARQPWEFLNVAVDTLARRICEPYGIPVAVQQGLVLWKIAKHTIDPGDSAFEALERVCRMAGVLPVAYGEGALLLTRAGATRTTTALVEGENILAASADDDASGRFRRYVVMGQHQGTDEYSGAPAAAVTGEAEDAGVRRADRELIVHAEGAVTPLSARLRAEWEAIVRAARGSAASVTVQGWTQADGKLWPVNALVPVRSPRLGIAGEMLISQVTYSLDPTSGTTTQLRLMRPDAFLPEPVVEEAPGAPSGRYEELARGV